MRLIAGYGESLTFTTDFALVPIVWTGLERDIQLSRIMATFYVGMIVGPPLSAIIYSYLGYLPTFLIFSGACIVTIVVIALLLPNYLNMDDDEEEDNQIQKTQEEIEFVKRNSYNNISIEEVGLCKILCNHKNTLAYFAHSLAPFFDTFYRAFLSVYLLKEFNLS